MDGLWVVQCVDMAHDVLVVLCEDIPWCDMKYTLTFYSKGDVELIFCLSFVKPASLNVNEY